jgi:hypothetical protein
VLQHSSVSAKKSISKGRKQQNVHTFKLQYWKSKRIEENVFPLKMYTTLLRSGNIKVNFVMRVTPYPKSSERITPLRSNGVLNRKAQKLWPKLKAKINSDRLLVSFEELKSMEMNKKPDALMTR